MCIRDRRNRNTHEKKEEQTAKKDDQLHDYTPLLLTLNSLAGFRSVASNSRPRMTMTTKAIRGKVPLTKAMLGPVATVSVSMVCRTSDTPPIASTKSALKAKT